MPDTTLIGILAALASTASFVPQAWKIIRSRNTASISATMYSVTVAAFLLWLVYGLRLQSWALVIPNAICLLLSGFILVMTLLPQKHKERIASKIDPVPDGSGYVELSVYSNRVEITAQDQRAGLGSSAESF